jgi:hypothetical protein
MKDSAPWSYSSYIFRIAAVLLYCCLSANSLQNFVLKIDVTGRGDYGIQQRWTIAEKKPLRILVKVIG